MLKLVKRVSGILLLAVALPGMANEMQCGEEYISGEQLEPLTQQQVVEKCGQPTSKEGFNWFYQQQGKILVFNSNGDLQEIRDAGE
jgi:hypothetical protein